MKIPFSIIVFISLFCASATAQFNNVYFGTQMPTGASIAIIENNVTGQYIIPTLSISPDVEINTLGLLNISENGNFDSLKIITSFSSPFFFGSSQSLIQGNGDYFFLGGYFDDSLFLQRIDYNLDTIWSVTEFTSASHFWGGGELPNGDLVIALAEENSTNYNVLKVNRYSFEGEFLNQFNIELDYDFGYPTTFIVHDSLVYVSFARLLIGAYRRNYIVCYNAITGEEIWETHQIENGEALGFTDGYMCMTTDGLLKLVYVEQTAPNTPTMFHTGWLGYFKVVNINPQTGEMSNESSLSGLEVQSYVLDVAPTDDGGMVVLFWGDDSEQPEYSFCGIKKINANMEVEWRNLYYQPIDLEVNENSSFLIELETTSDDCIVAVGDAVGENIIEEWSFHYPWVLKVDACGNEMVNDCELSNIQENDLNATIQVYPNPAKDRIYLKGNEAIKRAEIFDLQGRKIFEENFSGAHEQTLFIDHIPPGLYLSHISTQSGKTRSVKVVVGE